MEFYMEPVIKMFDYLKIKILKAGFKRTAHFCQIIIKNVFLTHLIQLQPTIADKTKEKSTCPLFWDTLYLTFLLYCRMYYIFCPYSNFLFCFQVAKPFKKSDDPYYSSSFHIYVCAPKSLLNHKTLWFVRSFKNWSEKATIFNVVFNDLMFLVIII